MTECGSFTRTPNESSQAIVMGTIFPPKEFPLCNRLLEEKSHDEERDEHGRCESLEPDVEGIRKHTKYNMIEERERNISYRIVFRLIHISLFLKDNLYTDALLN